MAATCSHILTSASVPLKHLLTGRIDNFKHLNDLETQILRCIHHLSLSFAQQHLRLGNIMMFFLAGQEAPKDRLDSLGGPKALLTTRSILKYWLSVVYSGSNFVKLSTNICVEENYGSRTSDATLMSIRHWLGLVTLFYTSSATLTLWFFFWPIPAVSPWMKESGC